MNTIKEDIELAKLWHSNASHPDGKGDGWRHTCYRLAVEVERACKWTEDDHGYWGTSCGHFHTFNSSGPEGNLHRFCPYCGGKLEVSAESSENKN